MSQADKIRKKFNNNKIFKKLLTSHFSTKFEELHEYLEEITRKFEKDLDDISSSYSKAKKSNSDEDDKYSYLIDDFYAEDFFKVKDIFLKNFHYSTLVSLCSIFESSLNELCQHLKHLHGYKLALGDMAGKGITRAISYLEKVCELEYNNVANALSEINKMSAIRNCIVHAEGDVSKATSTKKITDIINNTRNISIDSDKIIIEKEYLEELTNYCQAVVIETIEQGFADKLEEK